MNLKSFFTGLLIGILMALLTVFLWPKNTIEAPIIVEKFQAERHSEEIQTPIHSVKAQGKKAFFTYEVPTEHYGLLRGEVQASRVALQYRHRIGVGIVLLNGEVLGRMGYSYKALDLSLYGGYDYARKESKFGAGIGYSFSF